MSAWALFVDVVGLVFTGLLMLVLGWAAIERGRIHREWARLRRESGQNVVQSVDWCMAMAAAAGCA
jgi:hypothetical protein